jgi:O-antigen ligase
VPLFKQDPYLSRAVTWGTVSTAVYIGLFLVFPVSLALTSILMAVFLVLWLQGGLWKTAIPRLRSNPVAIAALALWAVIVLGVAWSPAPWADVQLHLSKYSKLLFVVALMTFWVEPRTYMRAINAFAIAMGFILVSTWLNVWTVLPWSKTQVPGWGLSHHVVGDHITQNVMMALFTLLALLRARAARDLLGMGGWIAVAALASVSITHLSEGRTGYLLLLAVSVYFVVVCFRGKALWAAALGALIVVAMVYASSPLVRDRVAKGIDEVSRIQDDKNTSLGNRLYSYQITPQLIAEKPLLGHGTGAYHTEVCRFVDTPPGCHGWISWHPHNQFLYFAVDHGALGLLAYLALLISMCWVAYRSADHEAGTLLGGLTVLLMVNGMINSPLWSARESHLFFFMMALLVPRALSTTLASPPEARVKTPA